MALSDFIDSIAPPWAKAASRVHWWSMFRLAGVLIDVLIEGVYQGRKAGMPNAVDLPGIEAYGGFEDVRSLDYIGEDLGVLHGLTESPPDYAYRLRHAASPGIGWQAGGLVTGVLEQLAGILGPTPPLMRVFQLQGGDWWTRNQDGSYVHQRHTGDGRRYNLDGTTTPDATVAVLVDWDSATVPPPADQGQAGRWGIVIYAPLNTPYGTTDDGTFDDPGIVGDLWNDPTTQGPDPGPWAGTVGTNAPICLVDLVRSVVAQRSMVGFACCYVVIAFDPDSFNPDGSSSGAYPTDGTWGHHTKFVAFANTRIPARLGTAEYWPAAPGGRAP